MHFGDKKVDIQVGHFKEDAVDVLKIDQDNLFAVFREEMQVSVALHQILVLQRQDIKLVLNIFDLFHGLFDI